MKLIRVAYQEYSINLTIDENFGPFDDVPKGVARLVHEVSDSGKMWDELSEEKKDKKESSAKSILCRNAPKYMSRALLSEIDPDGDLLQWFQDINDLFKLE